MWLCNMAKSITWTTEKVSELIELYEAYPCLYNTKDKSCFDRDLKSKAFAEIATALEISGIASYNNMCRFADSYMYPKTYLTMFVESDVSKKIKNIRTQYTREKQKS